MTYTSLLLLLLPLLSMTSSCPDECSCSLTLVNCSNLQLTAFPHNIPVQTTILDLSHNRLRDSSLSSLKESLKRLPNLQQLSLKDNIFTTPPEYSMKNLKIDLRDNPLHCNCSTLRSMAQNQILAPSDTFCSTTSNPRIREVYLAKLTTEDLKCGEEDLIIPESITLYRLPGQIIPCRKSPAGTVTWIKYGEIIYKTSMEDCSLRLPYVTSRDKGFYEIRYKTAYRNKTVFINVGVESGRTKPSIDVQRPLIEVQRRGTTKIECNATGTPPPDIEWTVNNRSIEMFATDNAKDSIILVNKRTIIVTDIETEMVFKCIATNVFGSSDATFIIKNFDTDRVAIIFTWLAPTSLSLMVLVGSVSAIYIIYSRNKLAKLKERCASPGSINSGTVFENSNSDAISSITQYDGYKIVAISKASPPHQLICPITRDCMKNPVVASDGFSYEEKAILAWFKRNNTSPMTNSEISKRLIQNHNLRTLIRDLMDKTPLSDSFINFDCLTPSERSPISTRLVPNARVSPNNHTEFDPASVSNVSTGRSRETSEVSQSSAPHSARSSSSRAGSSSSSPPTEHRLDLIESVVHSRPRTEVVPNIQTGTGVSLSETAIIEVEDNSNTV